MSPDPHVLFHNVHDHNELGEDEDSVAVVLHLRQQVIQQVELAAVAYQVVAKTQMFDTLQQKLKCLISCQDEEKSASFPLPCRPGMFCECQSLT